MLNEAQTGVTNQSTDKQIHSGASRTTGLKGNSHGMELYARAWLTVFDQIQIGVWQQLSMDILKFGKTLNLSDSQDTCQHFYGQGKWKLVLYYYTTQWLYWRGHRNS
jgi:hypothetical protein